MNLPNYFLADLPPEATLNAALIQDACQSLKRNRAQYLATRSTESLIRILAETAENWLRDDYPFRRLALERGPKETGFSAPVLRIGLDHFFRQLTGENLQALLTQELGHWQRLDEPVATLAEQKRQRAAMANGPEFLLHIAAGNVPNPTLMSMVLGLLVRSAQFVKCGSGASFIPRLFAHSIYENDPKLGACLEVANWRGGDESLESVLFAEANCVTATGSDETLSAIRKSLPIKARFLGYGHQVSFGFIGHETLTSFGARRIVEQAASDVTAWDQLGCLSPHVFYVEHGSGMTAEQFAEALATELGKREADEPRGQITTKEAAMIATRRSFYEVRAAHSPDTRFWCSRGSTAWTVVFENDPRFQLSCLNRFIYVKGVSDLTQAMEGADTVRGQVSTVGLAIAEEKAPAAVAKLSRWGVTRVCPLGQMQNPPLLWRHDGRPALADLITWTDWEL